MGSRAWRSWVKTPCCAIRIETKIQDLVMNNPNIDWNKVFEFGWRILVFVVAIGIIFVVSTNWTRWEGGAGWQRTNDAYLQADLTPISAKVAGYVRELPIQDFERVHKGQVLAQL